MRAVSLNDPDLARGAAESDQVLSEKPQLYRRPIALHDLLFEQRWSPKTPQQIPHRGARPNAGQHVVVLLRQHNATSLIRFHAESHASCRPHAPAWRFDTKPISRFVQAWPTACLSPRHTVNVQCQPLHALNGICPFTGRDLFLWLSLLSNATGVPSETQARIYWWCKSPKTGTATVAPQ